MVEPVVFKISDLYGTEGGWEPANKGINWPSFSESCIVVNTRCLLNWFRLKKKRLILCNLLWRFFIIILLPIVGDSSWIFFITTQPLLKSCLKWCSIDVLLWSCGGEGMRFSYCGFPPVPHPLLAHHLFPQPCPRCPLSCQSQLGGRDSVSVIGTWKEDVYSFF